ncbi:hypothetical protein ACFQVC_11465 [Streptomyces monticola]|uniref:Uncharacterized protein n=1 Tax=Streptomyces monticola TaxID=2666263 RepID=A0ABW2JGY6_9ACTN
MSTRRRTLVRTAAVTAVSGALLIPASAAFADSPTPAPSETATTKPSPEPSKDAKDKKQDEKKKDEKTGQRKLVNTVKLADKASTAKIYKLGQNHYEADIFANGAKLDTLVANGKAAYGQNNGLHVALQPDGQIKSWVEGGKKDEKKKDKKGHKDKVVPNGNDTRTPRGGVKAGAEGVETGQSPALLAAGGGIAAAGAAGLGFAMLRRGRTDS